MTLSELCLRTTDIGKGWQLVEDFSISNEGCNKQIRLKIQEKKTLNKQTNKKTAVPSNAAALGHLLFSQCKIRVHLCGDSIF